MLINELIIPHIADLYKSSCKIQDIKAVLKDGTWSYYIPGLMIGKVACFHDGELDIYPSTGQTFRACMAIELSMMNMMKINFTEEEIKIIKDNDLAVEMYKNINNIRTKYISTYGMVHSILTNYYCRYTHLSGTTGVKVYEKMYNYLTDLINEIDGMIKQYNLEEK